MQLHAIKAWYDNRLGMVELEDDVLSVVRQIREMYDGRVTVNLDPDTGCYHLVEHCEDHVDRLIFSVEQLDPRVLERLMMGDSTGRSYLDPYDASERAQDEAQRQIDEAYKQELADGGERLIQALRKDGRAPRMPLPVAIPKELPRANDNG